MYNTCTKQLSTECIHWGYLGKIRINVYFSYKKQIRKNTNYFKLSQMYLLRFKPLWFVWLVELCFFKASSAFFLKENSTITLKKKKNITHTHTHVFTTYFSVFHCNALQNYCFHLQNNLCVKMPIQKCLNVTHSRLHSQWQVYMDPITFFFSLAYFFCRASSSSVSELGNTTMMATATIQTATLTN